MGVLSARSRLLLFEKLISAVTLVIYLSLLSDYSLYFGNQSNFIVNKLINGSPQPILVDFLSYWPQFTPLFLVLIIITSGLSLYGIANFPIRIVRATSFFYLHQRLWTVADGGMNLLVLSHFYLILLDLHIFKKQTRLFNLALLWLLQGQFILIYIVAFISKMSGPDWVSGEALGYIVNIDKFRSHFLLSLFSQLPFLVNIFTRLVVAVQAILPVILVFATGRLLNLGIIIGLLLHLGIGVHMGLIGFSAIMAVHYSLFISDNIRRLHFSKNENRRIIVAVFAFTLSNYLCVFLSTKLADKTTVIEISNAQDRLSAPTTDDSIIEYASISKLFTLQLIDRLIRDDHLSLTERFPTEMGDFSLTDLLKFRAGIKDKPTSRLNIKYFSWNRWQDYFSVEKDFNGYSNFSYAMVQKIIETKYRQEFRFILKSKIDLDKHGISDQKGGNTIFNPLLLAAFGLSGPIVGLRSLTPNFSENGFCIRSGELCTKGIEFKTGGYYFAGTHGSNYLFTVFSHGKVYAINTSDSFFDPRSVFYE